MISATRLRCEYLIEPLGLGVKNPLLSWNINKAQFQKAYQIQAFDGEQMILDTGKVESSDMEYLWNLPLKSSQQVTWKVRLWDENDQVGKYKQAHFEMGLLHEEDLKAKWIQSPYKIDKKKRYPVDCFRKEFHLDDTPSKARLFASALGIYIISINGSRVGNFEMAPGYTDYTRRIQMQMYDVTYLLKKGINTIEVQLADGWFRGATGAWGLVNQYGTRTMFISQLEIVENNQLKTIISDDSWMYSNDGPILKADNKDGEIVDLNKSPSYLLKAKLGHWKIFPTPSNNVPVTSHEHIKVQHSFISPSKRLILDFGQNIAGQLSFKIQAHKGQKIFMECGELLDEKNELTLKNIQCATKKRRTPLQRIELICKEGVNEYRNHFSVFGFRYVSISSDIELDPKDFNAIAIYSDVERNGEFISSNSLLNKFVDCTLWSAKSNSLDIPTDCPTRERHGWTGDAQIFASTACYLFDYLPFERKYLNDVYDWQKKDGKLPQIVPYGGVDFYMNTLNGSSGWADAGVIIPYVLWKRYQDIRLIEEHYQGMLKYAKFLKSRIGRKTLLSNRLHLSHKARKWAVNYGQSYGEWAEPKEIFHTTWTDIVFPHPEVSTAYTSYIFSLLSEIARALNHKNDADKFAYYAKKTKFAYSEIRKTKDYPFKTKRMASNVRALAFNLLEGEQKKAAEQGLLEALDSYSWRIGTGFLSTPLILDVLSNIDIEYAYRLLENEKMPGWLFMPKSGATTVWESWEGDQAPGGIGSLNHYSKGAMVEWLFTTCCGINIQSARQFVLSPKPGGHLTFAKASYMSKWGQIKCSWTKKQNKYIYEVEVPSNCLATFIYRDGHKEELNPGTYTLEEKI